MKRNITDGAVFGSTYPAAGIQKYKRNESESIKEKPVSAEPKKKVLLVEDDDFSAFLTMSILKNFCEIDLTDTGEKAIEMAEKKNYEIILMDIGLRGINGVEAASRIRKIKNYENVPIVALTAFAMSGDKEDILSGGCSHYLAKPFGVKDLLSIFNEICAV